jgi:hypothetical protein
MEGPTSSSGLRNGITRITLQEHNYAEDDDGDDDVPYSMHHAIVVHKK